MDPSNNVKAKLLLLTSLLAIILIISAPVVNSVLVNLINPTETVPLSSSPADVFVDPDKIIKDYELDPGYQIGDTFTVHVNVSGVTDLFTWQINMTWNSTYLNLTSIIPGEFLARHDTANTTSEVLYEELGYIVVINSTDNVQGCSAFAESVLGNVSGIPGPTSGRLVSLNFTVVEYGCCNLTINTGGTLPTMLLNSTANSEITFTAIDGYFRNKIAGDADGDTYVNIFDILKVKYHWYPGPPVGDGGYERNVDIDDDGYINIFDILLVKNNWGRHVVI